PLFSQNPPSTWRHGSKTSVSRPSNHIRFWSSNQLMNGWHGQLPCGKPSVQKALGQGEADFHPRPFAHLGLHRDRMGELIQDPLTEVKADAGGMPLGAAGEA